MKYAIVFLFTVIVSCGLTRAVEYPSGSGQSSYLESTGSSATLPSSQGTAFSRPILRAGNPNDIADDLNKTNGDDETENVNDNNAPIADGVLIAIAISIVYAIGLTIKRQRKLEKIN